MSQDSVTSAGIDATVGSIGSKMTIGGSVTATGSWFLSSEFGVLFGLIVGVLGLLINWYFKSREDRRRQTEHEARMRALRGET